MTELEKLQTRWLAKVGDIMPDAITQLPVEKVRFAVSLVEDGATVVVSKEPRHEKLTDDSNSMADWDLQDDKNGNAYGS